MTAWFKHSRA